MQDTKYAIERRVPDAQRRKIGTTIYCADCYEIACFWQENLSFTGPLTLVLISFAMTEKDETREEDAS